MPVFRTKKEAFEWLKTGKKTVDVRKGSPYFGDVGIYLSGRNVLRLKIERKETGHLIEVLRLDNYRLVIPSAETLDAALAYFGSLYSDLDGVFTAYYVAPLDS